MNIDLNLYPYKLLSDTNKFVHFKESYFGQINHLTLNKYLNVVFLSYHPTVNSDIVKVKEKLRYKGPSDLSGSFSVPDILHFFLDEGVAIEQVKSETKLLLEKYRLTDDWLTPVMTKLALGILLIPEREDKFEFWAPNLTIRFLEEKVPEMKELSEYPDINLKIDEMFHKRNYGFSAILIHEKPRSVNELIEWIRGNWTTIEPNLEKLPKRLFEDADVQNFTLGAYAFYRRDLGKSWKDIDIELESIYKDGVDVYGPGRVCNRKDLQKYASITKMMFRQFYPF